MEELKQRCRRDGTTETGGRVLHPDPVAVEAGVLASGRLLGLQLIEKVFERLHPAFSPIRSFAGQFQLSRQLRDLFLVAGTVLLR
ncbi:hypothetical protein [Nonomuraea sp. NPDC048901]|uniref:hypothetical protein n=1 Tax=unclassified Nonomuraea TaxID=2593643 RepID=UPI0033C7FB27